MENIIMKVIPMISLLCVVIVAIMTILATITVLADNNVRFIISTLQFKFGGFWLAVNVFIVHHLKKYRSEGDSNDIVPLCRYRNYNDNYISGR